MLLNRFAQEYISSILTVEKQGCQVGVLHFSDFMNDFSCVHLIRSLVIIQRDYTQYISFKHRGVHELTDIQTKAKLFPFYLDLTDTTLAF